MNENKIDAHTYKKLKKEFQECLNNLQPLIVLEYASIFEMRIPAGKNSKPVIVWGGLLIARKIPDQFGSAFKINMFVTLDKNLGANLHLKLLGTTITPNVPLPENWEWGCGWSIVDGSAEITANRLGQITKKPKEFLESPCEIYLKSLQKRLHDAQNEEWHT